MDIQYIFYWFATIAMGMTIVLLLGMVILLFYIKKKIADLDRYGKFVIHKADSIVEEVKNKVQAITNFPSSLLGKSQK